MQLFKYYITSFLVLIFFSGNVNANKLEDEFGAALKSSAYGASMTDGSIKGFEGVKDLRYSSAFMWRITVQGSWEHDNGNLRNITNQQAYFEVDPEGKGFTYVMSFQDIPVELEEEFYKRDDVIDLWEEVDEELREDLGLEFRRYKDSGMNIFQVTAKDLDNLNGRLREILIQSRMILTDTGQEMYELMDDRIEYLLDNDLKSPLSMLEFEKLLKIKHDYYKEDTKIKGGEWSIGFEGSNTSFDIENNGTEAVFYVSREFADDSDERRAKRVESLAVFLKDEDFDEAHSTEAVLFPGFENYVAAKIVFKLDGSKTGEDLRDCYQEIWDDFSDDIGEALDDS